MKNLSLFQMLSANRSGELKLSVETDMVSVSTHFQDLHNPTSMSIWILYIPVNDFAVMLGQVFLGLNSTKQQISRT